MVAVHTQQATKTISARSDVGGPFIDFVHCTVYHKSHVGSHLSTSYSELYIRRFQLFSTSAIARSQAAFLRGLDSRLDIMLSIFNIATALQDASSSTCQDVRVEERGGLMSE